MKHISYFVLILVFITSCINHEEKLKKTFDIDSLQSCSIHQELKYAEFFSVYLLPNDKGYLLNVNTSSNEIKRILLVRDSSEFENTPSDIFCFTIPLSRIATNTTTHLEFFHLLDDYTSLCGICNSDYIFSELVYNRVKSGEITELGNSLQVDREKLMLCHPQILFVSDEREKPKTEVCPSIICEEWKEKSPLGRAEWIKFFSLFLDQWSYADSLFDDTERKYLTWKNLAFSDSNKPTIFAAGCYGDTWYLTGGDSYMSQLYKDANAIFCLADTMVGTVTCGLEWVLTHFQKTKYWVNCQSTEFNELDYRLASLLSVKEKNVFHYNKRSKKGSHAITSDFYESAVAHPDLVLGDVVSILHSDFVPDYETIYMDRLK